jgi:hypothetical protein
LCNSGTYPTSKQQGTICGSKSTRDPCKEWIQLRYYIADEYVEMAMRYWPDDWRIPVLTQEVPQGMKVDASSTKTPTRDKVVPKNPKPTHNLTQQKKVSVPKKDVHSIKKDTSPAAREHGMGDRKTQEIPSITTPQEKMQPKRLIIQIGGSRKKAKAHKQPPEYTITEDDADLVVEKVQEHAVEEFKDAQHQKGQIQDELDDIRQVLEHIRRVHRLGRGIESVPIGSEAKERVLENEKDTIQNIAQEILIFIVTPNMLEMDEMITRH